jgi:uncharacterized DUF497 family protein
MTEIAKAEVEFEWDPKKAKYNLKKHGVSFEEASSVFGGALAVVYEDPDHSLYENRYLMIGTSIQRRLIHVAFADDGERIRIISARKPTKLENKLYEEENR